MKEFIIIGAGILGASTAYHLAKAGENVTVIDRHDPGQATDAAAGIICPWLSQRRNKAWYALAKGGAAYYETLINQLKEDGELETGYRKVGAISLHTDAEKLAEMEERAIKRREDAPEIGDIRVLNPFETAALFPPLSKEYSSLYISGAARVDGRALSEALVNAAKTHGAKFVHGSAHLEYEGNKITGVNVGSDQYAAEGIIVTAGAWADQLLAPLGISFKFTSQKGQIIHLAVKNTETGNWPVILPPNDQYILAFDKGRIVVGTTHESEKNFDLSVTAGGMHEILDKALAIAPGLADAAFIEARVGYRPFTPGFLPIIGEVPGYNNLYLANGLGASGLTVGPYLGAQLAKLALGEQTDIDLDLYKVGRAL